MKERVVSVAGASAVEAVEANIEAGGVVLSLGQFWRRQEALESSYDRVEALGAVFAVYRLCRPGSSELCQHVRGLQHNLGARRGTYRAR